MYTDSAGRRYYSATDVYFLFPIRLNDIEYHLGNPDLSREHGHGTVARYYLQVRVDEYFRTHMRMPEIQRRQRRDTSNDVVASVVLWNLQFRGSITVARRYLGGIDRSGTRVEEIPLTDMPLISRHYDRDIPDMLIAMMRGPHGLRSLVDRGNAGASGKIVRLPVYAKLLGTRRFTCDSGDG